VRQALKGAISRMVRSDLVWRVLDATVLPAARYADRERRLSAPASPDTERAIAAFCPDLTVRNGVFKGLRYLEQRSFENTLVPKLLGSYEQELRHVLERICLTNYSEILNIGCAEGYYAVGLAMRIPGARVHAFDTSEAARRACGEMARQNGVSARVTIGSTCDVDALCAFPFTGRGLALSDCEGAEKDLFTSDAVRTLARHDILVEVHDCIDIEISTQLRSAFAATHDIEVVRSVDDITKAHEYSYPELEAFDLATRRRLLAEHRPTVMEWFFATPRRERSA